MRILYLDLDTLRARPPRLLRLSPQHLAQHRPHRRRGRALRQLLLLRRAVPAVAHRADDRPLRHPYRRGRPRRHAPPILRMRGPQRAASAIACRRAACRPRCKQRRAAHGLRGRLRRTPCRVVVLCRLPRDLRHRQGRHGVGRGRDADRPGLDRAQRGAATTGTSTSTTGTRTRPTAPRPSSAIRSPTSRCRPGSRRRRWRATGALAGPHSRARICMFDNRRGPALSPLSGRTARHGRPAPHDRRLRLRHPLHGRATSAGSWPPSTRQGVLDDLAIIISSDHGENLGELGIYGEHGTADQPTCRIPMIIRWPGGRRAPSTAACTTTWTWRPPWPSCSASRPRPRVGGPELRPGDDAAAEARTGEYLVLSQCAHVCQRSVRWGAGCTCAPITTATTCSRLRCCSTWPTTRTSRRTWPPPSPTVCDQGLRYLTEWHDQHDGDHAAGLPVDPMRTVLAEGGPFHARGQLRAYVERLFATGRGYAVEELRRRHPEEFA